MLLDTILPEYQVSASYSIDIMAPKETVFKTISNSSVTDSMIFRTLMKIREMPSRLFGKGEVFFPEKTFHLFNPEGKSIFSVLGVEENEEFVLGIIGRFWDVINTDPRYISGLNEFKAFNRPEYGKAAINFYLEPSGDKTKLYTETRVYFSDNNYLNRFRVYWFVISYFSGIIRKIMLNNIKTDAEKIGSENEKHGNI